MTSKAVITLEAAKKRMTDYNQKLVDQLLYLFKLKK